MKIAYCTNVRLPNERAHGHQVACVCDALSKLGHEVSIFAPYRKNPITKNFHEFHTVSTSVQITHCKSFDGIACPFTPGVIGLWLTTWSYCRKLRSHLQKNTFDLLYTRTPEILSTLLAANIPAILELHKLPRLRRRFVEQCKKCSVVACLTSLMRDELVSWGVPRGKTIVEGDAVRLTRFDGARPLSLENMHDESGAALIGYAGQLDSMGLSKGIPELLDSLVILRSKGIKCLGLIAGPRTQNKHLSQRIKNEAKKGLIDYWDFLPWDVIPSFLVTCDVLVYPAPASTHPFYRRDTSPLKIFEYMAAERPIVAADLPPIRDILDESTAEFFRPGDAGDLARAIQNVLNDPGRAQAKARRARQRVEGHTWEKRMERIMHATEQRL